MKKRVQIYEDGSQALVYGSMNVKSNVKDISEEYELDVGDEEFKEWIKNPKSVRVDRIRNKRLVMRGRRKK